MMSASACIVICYLKQSLFAYRKIFAFDQDIKRFSTLNILTIKAGASCVQAKLTDFMKVDPNDPAYKDVKYILVDPSCSGTGERGIFQLHSIWLSL